MKTYTNTSKRWAVILSSVCLLALSLTSCLKNNNQDYVPPAVAYVAFFQASPNQPTLDFYLDNNKVNTSPIAYGNSFSYFNAYAGARVANFYAQGSTTPKLATGNINLVQGVPYSLYLVNTPAHAETLLLTDSISAPAAGKASIRFVNVSPDAPTVDLVVHGGATLASNKIFKGHSSFTPLDGQGKYTFDIVQHGTTTVLTTLQNVTISAGYVYTISLNGLAASTNASDKPSASIFTNATYSN